MNGCGKCLSCSYCNYLWPCQVLQSTYYLQLEIVRNEYPQLHIVSLCQPQETGYHHQKFELLTPQEKKESIIRLLVSVDILLHCSAFVGTITSGPSVFLMKVRADDPCVTAIDCPQDMLPDCLTLTIDARAVISQSYVAGLTNYTCTSKATTK